MPGEQFFAASNKIAKVVSNRRFAFFLTPYAWSDSLLVGPHIQLCNENCDGIAMHLMRKTFAFAGSFFLLGTMIAFFGFHTVAGDRGILARPQLEHKIIQAQEELSLLKKRQSFLSHRISLMHKDAIDADILAETARSELGLFSPNDVIISIDLSDLKF